MLFDLGRISDKPQQIGFGVVFILLGLIGFHLSRDFRWASHTVYICWE